MGYVGGSAYILGSVYSTLFLDNWKLRNFLRLVRIEAAVDANVDMYNPPVVDA